MSTSKAKVAAKPVKKDNTFTKQTSQVQKLNNKKTPPVSQKKDNQNIKTVEKEKQYFYLGCVLGLKYVINSENHNPVRKVKTLLVWADHDLANEPDTFKKEMESAENALLDEGYYLKEEDALAGLTFTVGCQLSCLAHDLEYNEDGCPCRNCMRNLVKDIEEVLKLARDSYHRHCDLQKSIPNACMVPVFPNPEDMDEFDVRTDGKLYLKNPPKNYKEHVKVSFGVIKPDELPAAIREGIDKFLKERHAKKDK